MPKSYSTFEDSDLIAKQINCSFKISNYDNISPFKIRDTIVSRLRRYNNDKRNIEFERENAIEQFIKTTIANSIGFRADSKIYIIDYKEREGSFIIDFSVLIVSSFIAYGSIRQSLDYFMKEVSEYFERTLGENSYNVSFDFNEITVFDSTRRSSSSISMFGSTVYKLAPMLSLFLTLIVAGLFTFYVTRKDAQASDQNSPKNMEFIIQQKINDAINQKKLDFIFQNIKLINDTIKYKK